MEVRERPIFISADKICRYSCRYIWYIWIGKKVWYLHICRFVIDLQITALSADKGPISADISALLWVQELYYEKVACKSIWILLCIAFRYFQISADNPLNRQIYTISADKSMYLQIICICRYTCKSESADYLNLQMSEKAISVAP